MSRVAKAPVALPKGVEVTLNGQNLQVKGSKGALALTLHDLVEAKQEGEQLVFAPRENTQAGWMQTGTARALASNYVKGVSVGFERKLQLVGVGYKAAAKGKVLNLALGFSHPLILNCLKVSQRKRQHRQKSFSSPSINTCWDKLRLTSVLSVRQSHTRAKVFAMRMR